MSEDIQYLNVTFLRIIFYQIVQVYGDPVAGIKPVALSIRSAKVKKLHMINAISILNDLKYLGGVYIPSKGPALSPHIRAAIQRVKEFLQVLFDPFF